MIKHDYVTIKLMNGDTLLAVLIDEKEDCFVIMYPIQMKSVSFKDTNKEVLAGTPWCTFTDEQIYDIWKNDVVLIKPLNQSTIEYYKRLVDIQEESEQTNIEYNHDSISVTNQTLH